MGLSSALTKLHIGGKKGDKSHSDSLASRSEYALPQHNASSSTTAVARGASTTAAGSAIEEQPHIQPRASSLEQARKSLPDLPGSAVNGYQPSIPGAGPSLLQLAAPENVSPRKQLYSKSDLASPPSFFPLSSVLHYPSEHAASEGSPNPAYIASRSYSYNPFPPPADPSEHAEHIDKHLKLLGPKIYQTLASVSTSPAIAKPGVIRPLEVEPASSSAHRDAVLRQQRDSLLNDIVEHEETARSAGQRARFAQGAEAERLFEQVGWKDRLGTRDTIDVHTKVLPAIVQEHVQPVETITYQLVIFREVHKYHIFPSIQPIRDPNPTVLPTRHLFRDRDGNLREVIGDEAAERVLGRRLQPKLDGETYYERWTESVDGISYQTEYRRIEDESVIVGRSAQVNAVGARMPNSTAHGEDHISHSEANGKVERVNDVSL